MEEGGLGCFGKVGVGPPGVAAAQRALGLDFASPRRVLAFLPKHSQPYSLRHTDRLRTTCRKNRLKFIFLQRAVLGRARSP